jgi:hypothetical protein
MVVATGDGALLLFAPRNKLATSTLGFACVVLADAGREGAFEDDAAEGVEAGCDGFPFVVDGPEVGIVPNDCTARGSVLMDGVSAGDDDGG